MNLFALLALFATYTIDPDSLIRGVYINPWQGCNKEYMDQIFAQADSGIINTIVVDLKGDYGYLTYASEISLAKKMGAVKKYLDLDYLIKNAAVRKMKLVARIVCFRDDYLARHKDYGMRDDRGRIWRDKTGTAWTNPYVDSVGDYLVSIVKEISALGVKSIAFDYIRFPTDGAVDRIRLTKVTGPRYKPIVKFLEKVRTNVPDVEIGACVFGFTTWYDLKNLGQILDKLGDHLDVVYPMLYPSHFPPSFKREVSEYWRNYWIYFDSVKGAFKKLPPGVKVVPFVQGFKLMAQDFNFDYVLAQLDGAVAADGQGFIIWNPGNDYATSWTPIWWVYNSVRAQFARTTRDTRTKETGLRYPDTNSAPSLFQ
jgi:hypothetical protein